MTNEAITYLVGAFCVVFAIAAYVAFILVPAWTAYSRWWQRFAAGFLSLYVLAAMLGVGIVVGAMVVWSWDRIAG
jgi:predicted PurR-regulated permease PerM